GVPRPPFGFRHRADHPRGARSHPRHLRFLSETGPAGLVQDVLRMLVRVLGPEPPADLVEVDDPVTRFGVVSDPRGLPGGGRSAHQHHTPAHPPVRTIRSKFRSVSPRMPRARSYCRCHSCTCGCGSHSCPWKYGTAVQRQWLWYLNSPAPTNCAFAVRPAVRSFL